jgi:hypothetical protein
MLPNPKPLTAATAPARPARIKGHVSAA